MPASAFCRVPSWERENAAVRNSAAETAINGYRFADLAEALRTFFWTDLCDWYLEIAKAEPGRFRVIDARGAVQQTQAMVMNIVMPFLKGRGFLSDY